MSSSRSAWVHRSSLSRGRPLAAVAVLGVVWLARATVLGDVADARPLATVDAATASNQFGFDLYLRLKRGHDNVICSPLSASLALTMTAAGAQGATLAEMIKVLHLDGARLPATHQSFARLLDTLNQRDGQAGLALRIANRLWGQSGFPFRQEFRDGLRAQYGAPLDLVDFVHAPDQAREAINRWAASETRDRIREVFPPGSLHRDTRLVLTSAIYFKGRWSSPFRRRHTVPRRFTASTGARSVPTMQQTQRIRYAKTNGLALAELPYTGGLSMLVLLPDAVDGLEAIEARLATEGERWRAALSPALVDVQLPRWRVTNQLPLGDALAALGMPGAFEANADFGGMIDSQRGGERLAIDRVLQQAFIEVDEDGTEAAAVTTVEMGKMGRVSATPVPFHADHPFLYLITDAQTGAVLFMGRVGNPEGP